MGKDRGLLELFHPQPGVPIVADIVFVHGLFGDRIETWSGPRGRQEASPSTDSPIQHEVRERRPSPWKKMFSKPRKNGASRDSGDVGDNQSKRKETPTLFDSKTFWPQELLPIEHPNIRIFTWGYDVDIDHAFSGASTATVFQHAGNLLSDIADVRIPKEIQTRPLFFIAHSLGGIVVKDAINQSLGARTHLKTIAPATRGICFLGTPHRGASIAALGETIYRISKLWGKSPNLSVLQSLKYDAETLDRVQSSFKLSLIDQRCNLRVRSYREAKKTLGITIVDRFSSVIEDPMEIVSDIDADHSNMTKFTGADDPGFVSLCNTLYRWIEELKDAQVSVQKTNQATENVVLRSLHNTEREHRIDQISEAYEGTFSWVYSNELQFKQWLCAGPGLMNAIYWIQGKPGSGKSTLMKYIIREENTRRLLEIAHHHTWTIVPFFFHDRGSQIQKSIKGLLKDVLFGLIDTNRTLSEFAMPAFLRGQASTQGLDAISVTEALASEKAVACANSLHDRIISKDVKSWSIKSLEEALIGILSQAKIQLNVLFFIDALDEHSGDQKDLLNIIRRCFLMETPPNVHVKFCLASRPEPVFKMAFESCPGLSIDEHTMGDIKRYIHGQIESSLATEDAGQDITELHGLANEIANKANGMFIWVRIVVEELIERLVDGYTLDHLREILAGIPEELQGLYHRVLSRIKPQYALESYILFQVITAVPIAHSSENVFGVIDVAMHGKYEKMTREVRLRRLASRSGGLLCEVGPEREIQYIHQTVKSFFERSDSTSLMFHNGEAPPLKDGMAYLLEYSVHVASQESLDRVRENDIYLSLLFYFAAQTQTTTTSSLISLLDHLMQGARYIYDLQPGTLSLFSDLHFFACLEFEKFNNRHPSHRSYAMLLDAASHGLVAYVENKLDRGIPLSMAGHMPLLHSVMDGFVSLPSWQYKQRLPKLRKIMLALIDKGADLEIRFKGATALCLLYRVGAPKYSKKSHSFLLECERDLLNYGADPNAAVYQDGKPTRSILSNRLQRMSFIEHDYPLASLQMLMEYGADCNQEDSDGFRPLFFALGQGHRRTVEALLQHGADPSNLGNGKNALIPETCTEPQLLSKRVTKMQPLLQSYKANSSTQKSKPINLEKTPEVT